MGGVDNIKMGITEIGREHVNWLISFTIRTSSQTF